MIPDLQHGPARRLRARLSTWSTALITTLLVVACGGAPASLPDSEPVVGVDIPPTSVLTLAVQGIKTLRLNWTDTGNETGYRLLIETGTPASRVEVATLPADSLQHDLPVFLPDQINARYVLQACTASGCVDAATAAVDTALLTGAVGYFKGTYRSANAVDWAGTSVALSADGSTLAVGARLGDHTVLHSGEVYVFERSPAGWVPQALLKAPSPTMHDGFGHSLALSADGQRLLVGDFPNNDPNMGTIRVYGRSQGEWLLEWSQSDPYPALALDDPLGKSRFGWAVAMSGDGNTLVAGRQRADTTAVVYARVDGNWVMQWAVPAMREADGTAYALSGDGNTLVVGRSGKSGTNTLGAVDVYTRVDGIWQTGAMALTRSDAQGGDLFGISVAIAGDGSTIAVGARDADTPVEDAGAVYVYIRRDAAWQQQAIIQASNPGSLDRFGTEVALSGDGRTLVATAPWEDGSARGLNGLQDDESMTSSGAAYVFRRTADAWQQSAYVKASNTDANDAFGYSVALSGDGRSLAVGATAEDSAATGVGGDQSDNSASARGAVYLY